MEPNKKKSFFEKLRYKYRVTLLNENTIKEVLSFRLSRLNVFAFLGLFFIIASTLVFVALLYTPLRVLLPTYNDPEVKRLVVENAMKLDSIAYEVEVRDQHIMTMKRIMAGQELPEYVNEQDTAKHYDDITFDKSKEDSLLRLEIENEDIHDVVSEDKQAADGFSSLHFFPPINKGMITNHFDADTEHYGVDIVAAPDEGVKATLDGTVIQATWTLATGHVIQLQHENNVLSIYKHNAALLKKVGDRVKAGEVIAIIGNSGELTTGAHLHFELWHNGLPIDPEDYIVF